MVTSTDLGKTKGNDAQAIVDAALKSRNNNAPAAPAPDGDKRHDKTHTAVEKRVYVAAMTEAYGFQRKALQLEIAINLRYFAEKNNTSVATKREVRMIYAEVGYDCKDDKGVDYKTVNRRINYAADLFNFIGGKETVDDWIDDAPADKSIAAILKHIEKNYKFKSMNDLRKEVGKPITSYASLKAPIKDDFEEGESKTDAAKSEEAPAPQEAKADKVEDKSQEAKADDKSKDEDQGEQSAAEKQQEADLDASVEAQKGKVEDKKPTPPPAPRRGLTYGEQVREVPIRCTIRTNNLHLYINIKATYEELMALADNVREFAERNKQHLPRANDSKVEMLSDAEADLHH